MQKGTLFHCSSWFKDDRDFVSYIKNSLRFWYYVSLSTCCQNLEKEILVTWKPWEKTAVKLLRDLTEKSANFSTLATSNIRLLLFCGEEDQ